MEEHIPQLSFRTGNGEIIEPANEFIYEFNKYAIYRKESRIELLESKFIKSKTFIKFKTRMIPFPEYKEYLSVSLIGAPREYLKYLPLSEIKKKKKKK